MLGTTPSRIAHIYHSAIRLKQVSLSKLLYPGGRPVLVGLGLDGGNEQSERVLRASYRLFEKLLVASILVSVFPVLAVSASVACRPFIYLLDVSPLTKDMADALHEHPTGSCRRDFSETLGPDLMPFAGAGIAAVILFSLIYKLVSDAFDFAFVIPEMPNKPFVLFLRSFFIESTIKAESSTIPFAKLNKSLFREIRNAIAPEWVASKIGSRRLWFDVYGSTVHAHDGNWESKFLALGGKAERIVMVPVVWQEDAGTHREIVQIVSRDWLGKTVFVVPPQGRLFLSPARGVGLYPSMRALWEKSRGFLRSRGHLELPEYPGRSGLLFFRDGQWIFFQGINGRYWNVRKALRQVLVDGRIADTPARNATRFASRLLLLALAFMFGAEIASVNISVIFDAVQQLKTLERVAPLLESIPPELVGRAVSLGIMVAILVPLVSMYLRYCKYFSIERTGARLLAFIPLVFSLAIYFRYSYLLSESQIEIDVWRSAYGTWIADLVWIGRLFAVWLVAYLSAFAILRWFDGGMARRRLWRDDKARPTVE